MDWLDSFNQEVQGAQQEQGPPPIAPAQLQPEIQKEPTLLVSAESQNGDWLDAFDTQVQEAQKVLEVPQDEESGKTFESWFDEKYSGTKEFLEASGEAAVQLGYGAISFLPSYGLGFATILDEKLKNVLRQDRISETVRRGGFPEDLRPTDLARKPMTQRLEEAKIKTPKEIRALADKSSEFFASVMEEPVTKGGKKVMEKAGELMEWLFHYPKVADEKLAEAGYPNLGYLTGFAGEMLLLKGMHGAAKKGKKVSKTVISRFIKTVEDVKDIKTPAQLNAVSRQVDKILDQLGVTEEQRIVATDQTFRAQRDVGSWIEERSRIKRDAKEVPSAKEITREAKAPIEKERPIEEAPERIRLRDVEKDRLEAIKKEEVIPKPKPQMSSEIERLYDEVMSELPENIRKDIEVISIKQGTFPPEHTGTGGKTLITGKLKEPEKYQIVLEKGEVDLKGTLKHELLHVYSLKHPEMVKKKLGIFGEEAATELLERGLPKPSVRKLNIEEQFGKRVAGEVSDGIKVAEDMGVFETIRAGVEGKKKVGEIMREVKRSRYYEEDLKDFGYVEKDLRSAIRAIKVREFGDVKIGKEIKAKLEKEVVKVKEVKEPKPKVPLVDVERGKPAGVKADLKKYEQPSRVKEELAEIKIRREVEKTPLRTAEGKIVGSKVLAMRIAKSRGMIGEVVRTPDKKGWYVKKTKEMKAKEVDATKKLWDSMLEEEGLGVLDILKEERGAITIREKVKKPIEVLKEEDLPFAMRIKPGAKELTYAEAMKKYDKLKIEHSVKRREVETFGEFNRLDGKKIEFIHHIIHKYNKTLLEAKTIADGFYEGDLGVIGVRAMLAKKIKPPTMLDILKSERGSVVMQPETIKKLRSAVKLRKVSEADLVTEMQRRKVPNSQILRAFPNAFKKTAVKGISEFLKKRQSPEDFLPRRIVKRKTGKMKYARYAPAVTRGDAHTVSTFTKDMPRAPIGEKVRLLATSEGIFTRLGKDIKETFYRPMQKAAKAESDFSTALIKEGNVLKKQFSIGTRQKHARRIELYAIAKQKDGLARLKAQGIKESEIPKELNAKEQIAYDAQQKVYRGLFRDINKARRAAGQQLFPPVENYSPWFHDLAKVGEIEQLSILDNLGQINKAMTRLREIPSQIGKIGRAPGLKGHEKFRAGPETPGYLHLNAFDNFAEYVKIASKAIHIGPTTAYLHELLLPKFKLAENAPNTWRFLSDWLDYQKGREPIMYIENPVMRRRIRELSSNIAVSYITYSFQSALNQMSSMNNTFALLGTFRTADGIAKAMSPFQYARASKESNILTVRSPEVALIESGRTYPLLPGKAGRTASDIWRKTRQIGSQPLMIADDFVAHASWLGAEAKAKRIFRTSKTYKEMSTAKRPAALKKFSRDYADDVVERAQGSASRAARAPIQRTAEGAAVTTLQTFVIAQFDFISRHILGFRNPDITKLEQVARVTRYILGTAAISYAFDIAGMRAPTPTPAKAFLEEKEKSKDYTKSLIAAGKELTEYLPVAGGRLKYGSELGGVAANEVLNLLQGDPTAVPRLLGVPGFNQFLKSFRASGRKGTNIDIIFGRYVEKPKKGRASRQAR